METQIQIISGKQYTFTLTNDVDPPAFFGTLNFWEIFDRNILRISNGATSWNFQPHLIEKIQFQSVVGIRLKTPENILSGKIIPETSYRQKIDEMEHKHDVQGVRYRPGDIAQGLAEMTLASGSVEYLEFMVMLRSPQEQMMDLSVIFQRPPFPIPCEDEGFVLINPANVSMIRIYPAMIKACGSDWPMDAVL